MSYTASVSTKPLTKYQLFVMEQRQRVTEITDKDDPIEGIIKGFAKIVISS
jgi:hypothetical protein